ncbi:MAG: hypothetical protein M3Y53_00625 [Thermoproteota archaeon]|nr:hypothetical protein [Thermoproteota archaeon]
MQTVAFSQKICKAGWKSIYSKAPVLSTANHKNTKARLSGSVNNLDGIIILMIFSQIVEELEEYRQKAKK